VLSPRGSFEEVFQPALVVGREVEDRLADRPRLAEGGEGAADRAEEVAVDLAQGEAHLGRDMQGWPGAAYVVEREGHETVAKLVREAGVRGARCAAEQDDDLRAVAEAQVEQLPREHVVARVLREEAHVPHRPERQDLLTRASRHLVHEGRGHDGREELLLALEVPVHVPGGDPGRRRHVADRGRRVAALRERLGRSEDDALADLFFGALGHQ
jgi:hypothetical protein